VALIRVFFGAHERNSSVFCIAHQLCQGVQKPPAGPHCFIGDYTVFIALRVSGKAAEEVSDVFV